MSSAAAIRFQIESALANRFPSALTPAPKIIRSTAPTGVAAVDALLEGGLPVGAITEMVGPQSSGRTSLALSFLAGITRADKVAAWVDVSNTLHPEIAAEAGIDLARLLWVRCSNFTDTVKQQRPYKFALQDKYLATSVLKSDLRCGGFGAHPRSEAKRLPEALRGLERQQAIAPRCAEPQLKGRPKQQVVQPASSLPAAKAKLPFFSSDPRAQIKRGLYVTDQLLQVGGFSALVLDMGSVAPEYATQVVMDVWFRLRMVTERAQTCLVLLTQHTCAKSSAELLLRFAPLEARTYKTVFKGTQHHLQVERRRFAQNSTNVLPLRKPPQSTHSASWHSQASWADVL